MFRLINTCLLLFAVCLVTLPRVEAETVQNDPFSEAVSGLTTRHFADKAEVISRIEQFNDERVLPILQAMLEGDLYYRKSDKRIVYRKDSEDGYRITDVLTNEDLGEVGRREVKKISVNNQLRGQLNTIIARLSLDSRDPAIRLAAVKQITEDISEDSAQTIRQKLPNEADKKVRDAMEMALALYDVNSPDKNVRLQAIGMLADSLIPEVRGHLARLLEQDSSGKFRETDADIRNAARASIKKIDGRLEYFDFIEKVFFGLSLGSVLLLAAIGLAITFGVMGVINMAHGELIMLGAYTTYVVQLMMPNHIDLSLFIAVPLAFLVSGLFGIAIERGVIRFLYGRPLETLLATFGISLILQQLVRTVFSPLNRSVSTPSWMSGSLEINSALSLTYNRLYIVIFSLLVFAVLVMILKKTSLGLKVRAVSQNRSMAKAMGVRSEWVDAMTFGLGSGIAGVAGVALSQLTNVGPNLGQSYIIDSFMVVVFGGVGNLGGTLVGAMSLGVFNKFLEPWTGAVLAKIFVLVLIILFIQKRPRGLFPQKGRAADN